MFSKDEAWEKISQSGENVIIATHHSPDGDAVGSAFALAQALRMLGIYPKIVIDTYNERLNVVKGKEFIYEGDASGLACDVLIMLDCGDVSRVFVPQELFERAKVSINIDHHLNNGNFGTYNYVDTSAAATAEIVFDILNMFVPINKYMADALYMGIVTDTGGFKYSATTSKTMEIASLLIHAGADFTRIKHVTMHSQNRTEVAIFIRALQNMKYSDNGIAYSVLTLADMEEIGAKRYHLEGIVEYMLNIDGIDVSAFICERANGRVKVSFRSHAINVREVAAHFGGGGHKYAAAADFEAGFDEGVAQILEALDRAAVYV